MKILPEQSDETILQELGARLTRVRLALNLTQAELAAEAGVGKRTVERLEAGAAATQLSGFFRVCRALGLFERLDALIPEFTFSPVEQLKLQGRKRQRASGRKATSQKLAKPGKWSWGEQ